MTITDAPSLLRQGASIKEIAQMAGVSEWDVVAYLEFSCSFPVRVLTS